MVGRKADDVVFLQHDASQNGKRYRCFDFDLGDSLLRGPLNQDGPLNLRISLPD